MDAMGEQPSLQRVDNLLLQIAAHTRELNQKKNELDQQITVYRAEIAEKKAHIESTKKELKKLEEENVLKQDILKQNKENIERMKATHSMLLQYEQTLKAELESAKNNYTREMESYEERLANYRKTFQEHKEYLQNNPLAQSLIKLLAEKEEMEGRIKAYNEQIAKMQRQPEHLSASGSSSTSEEPADSVRGEPIAAEADQESDLQPEEDLSSTINISCLDLHSTKEAAMEENREIPEENLSQDAVQPPPENTISEQNIWTCQQLEEQSQTEEEEEEEEMMMESGAVKPSLHSFTPPQTDGNDVSNPDQQTAVLEAAEGKEEEEKEEDKEDEVQMVSPEKVQAPGDEDKEKLSPPSSSEETFRQPSPVTAAPETPTFQFPFSGGVSSLHRTASDTNSPVFSFSLGSEPSTPGFSGLVFDMGSPKDEDSSFTFPSSFFNEKKATDSKSAGANFLFDQSEQGEDFQFTFTSKSPPTTSKGNTGEEFPFSFNF